MQAFHRLLPLFVCVSLASAVAAQSASFQVQGAACSSPAGAITLGHVGAPVLGQSFDVTYSGPSGRYLTGLPNGGTLPPVETQLPHLTLGFQQLTPGFLIPQAWFPQQPANCSIDITHDAVVPMAPVGSFAFATTFTIAIPNVPGLMGLGFFVQWITPDAISASGQIAVEWVATSAVGVASIGT